MAVAPLNKFITIALPVAPGEQVIYTTPVGVSAILLYAQVSNVGVNTYPHVTFSHRRLSNRTKNVRTNRIAKEVEIPPNDSVILIDGRLVLERNALIADSLVVSGTQSGIVSVFDCKYDNTTGLTTVTTYGAHNFSVNDEITMAGLAFTCPPGSGITTSLFPSPQTSFVVSKVTGGVGSTIFETNSGTIAGIQHTYVNGGKVGPLQMEFICSILENSTV